MGGAKLRLVCPFNVLYLSRMGALRNVFVGCVEAIKAAVNIGTCGFGSGRVFLTHRVTAPNCCERRYLSAAYPIARRSWVSEEIGSESDVYLLDKTMLSEMRKKLLPMIRAMARSQPR